MTDLIDEMDDDIMDIEEPNPKIWLYPFLADLGVTKIEASMSGGGDSGEIDDVVYYHGDEVITPKGEDAQLETPDSGIVLTWFVSGGMIVRKGDPICEVDPVEAREALALCRERLSAMEAGVSDKSGPASEREALADQIRDLEQRAAMTLLTAPEDGFVNAFDSAEAMKGYRSGATLLDLTPLSHIDDILSKMTLDDGTSQNATFKDVLEMVFENDGSSAGDWVNNEGGSAFCSYDLNPELGRMRLVDVEYTPGEEYGDEEEDDWEPDLAEPDEEDNDDVEP